MLRATKKMLLLLLQNMYGGGDIEDAACRMYIQEQNKTPHALEGVCEGERAEGRTASNVTYLHALGLARRLAEQLRLLERRVTWT